MGILLGTASDGGRGYRIDCVQNLVSSRNVAITGMAERYPP